MILVLSPAAILKQSIYKVTTTLSNNPRMGALKLTKRRQIPFMLLSSSLMKDFPNCDPIHLGLGCYNHASNNTKFSDQN